MRDWMQVLMHPRSWGARRGEAAIVLDCDAVMPQAHDTMIRAGDVAAPPAHVFRWLCQLRAAPYSYDWIDNGGRRSPPYLREELEHVEVGQRWMTIFRLAAFEPGRSVTLVIIGRSVNVFGEVAITYAALPEGDGTRLLARLRVRYPRGLHGLLMRWLLPLGDAIMMRKQLLTLKAHAERTR